MTYTILLVAHIAVLGYWLGSDLCINSEYRFICYRDDLDFAARDAMTDHLMDVDQHVRYALILQLTLGTMLAAQAGYVSEKVFWVMPLLGVFWITLIETAHRQRKTDLGQTLAMIDRYIRYGIAILLIVLATGMLPTLPFWLRMKLGFFAGLICCGIIIRYFLMRHFRVWTNMRENGPDPSSNAIIRKTHLQATSVLGVLWFCVVAITVLAVWKP